MYFICLAFDLQSPSLYACFCLVSLLSIGVMSRGEIAHLILEDFKNGFWICAVAPFWHEHGLLRGVCTDIACSVYRMYLVSLWVQIV